MTSILKSKSALFWARFGICSILFFGIGFYAFTKMSGLVYGVDIRASIAEDSLASSLYTITGSAKHAALLKLNGREISIDKEGSFTEIVVLPPGLSVVTIVAEDKFGNDSEETMQIYTQDNKVVAFNTN